MSVKIKFQNLHRGDIFAEHLTMKKFVLVCSVILAGMNATMAQTSNNPWGISVSGVFKEYNGEFGRTLMQFRYANIQGGVAVTRYINNWIDASVNLNYGNFYHDPKPWFPSAQTPTLNFKGLNTGLTGRFKFNNGEWLKEEAFLAPYVSLGLGYFTGKRQLPDLDATWQNTGLFHIPMGVGLNVRCSKRLEFNLSSQWMMSFTDKFDGVTSGKRKDQLMEHRFGFTYNLGKAAAKAEGEGSDKKDKKAKKDGKEKKEVKEEAPKADK